MRLGVGAPLLFIAACAGSTPANETKLPTLPISLRIDRIDGGVLTIGSLRGRVVLVNVFTTWADLALLEVPRLKSLAKRYDPKELVIVGIALDQDLKMVKIFARTFEIPYYVGLVADPAVFTSADGPFGKIALLHASFPDERDGSNAERMDGMWNDGIVE